MYNFDSSGSIAPGCPSPFPVVAVCSWNPREGQQVATRSGLAQLAAAHGSGWQRVATHIGLAQLDGSDWQLVRINVYFN